MVKQKKKYIWNPACMDWSPGVAVLRLANEATAASFWSGCLLAGGWPEAGHAGHAGHLGIDVKVDPVQIGWSSWLLEIGCWFGVSNKVARMKIDKKAMWIWMWSSDFKSLRLYFLDCSNPSNIEKKNTLLRVIPTMTSIRLVTGISSGILPAISSAICSGISSGTLSGISSGISSDILSGILSGKSSGICSGKHSGT